MRTSIDLLEQKKVLGQFPAEASGSHFSDLCQERSVPEFLKELYEKRQKGFKLSLDPLRRAQEKIQWNSKPNCSIQVVGTNGKGTTATAIARSLARFYDAFLKKKYGEVESLDKIIQSFLTYLQEKKAFKLKVLISRQLLPYPGHSYHL